MNMDAAGGVGKSTLVAKLPHQFLDGGNISVGADGADQLGFVGGIRGYDLTTASLLRDDAPGGLYAVQLFGNEPEILAHAIEIVREKGIKFDIRKVPADSPENFENMMSKAKAELAAMA